MSQMLNKLMETAKGCGIVMLPFIITFLVFQVIFIKMNKENLKRTLFGVFISYLGLVFLLSGLNLCYIPIAKALGFKLSTLSYRWIVVPIGFLLGIIMTCVEPSVKVLISNITKETGGALNEKMLMITMCVGVGISLVIAMLKLLFNFSLWYILVPGYILIIVLSFSVDEKFTAIALDAGGVTTGVMTTTFLLPLAMGLASGLHDGANSDGLGLIAIVAMTPIIMVMLLGVLYTKNNKSKK